ncbi:MAG TPA: hypothetical protein VIL03_01900 [Clostridia bacterium]
MNKNLIIRCCIILFSVVILGLVSFTTFALTNDNFDALLGGLFNVISSDIKRPEMPNRTTIIITKDSTDIVIQSGYNYIFKGSHDWGSKNNPIDLNKYAIIKGASNKPLDAYIDGRGYYFKLDLNRQQAADGYLGVFSGAIVDFNLYQGNIEHSPETALFASTLTKEGVIYNCSNYINLSSYEGVCAGFVKNAEGLISKSVNYGKVEANGYAAAFAYSVKGRLVNCENYGVVESKNEQAAGIAWAVQGSLNNCLNFGSVLGNKAAAGIAVRAEGAILLNCKNGFENDKNKILIRASSGPAVGIIYEAFNKSLISNCANFANIDGSGAFGIGYNIYGDIIDTKNHGNMSSYQTCAGIANNVQGALSKVYNYGNITTQNSRASGLVHSLTGNINDSHNLGQVQTSDGSAAGLVYQIQGNIIDSTNNGIIKKTGWSSEYVAGLAGIAEGKIENSKNKGKITIDNNAQYIGGIAAVMKGQIINCNSESEIAQNNEHQFITVGGIAAVLENIQGALIKDSRFFGGFNIKSRSANKHYIACIYPTGTIVNCAGMGQIYNL